MVMSKDENENEKEGRGQQNEPGAERPPPGRAWEIGRAADAWGDTPDRTRNRREDMSAGTSLNTIQKGGEYVKDFFKCTAVVLAVIAFGLVLSAIVRWPNRNGGAQARRH